ncbi:MAG: hypothetical protein V7711_16755 [Pseudomonadales bacterium]
MLKQTHLCIGLVGLALFLLSGQYFALQMGGLQDLEDTPRLLLRTSHVYLFFSSMINITLGLYFVQSLRLKWYTVLNHCLVLVSPVLLVYSLVFEAFNNTGIERELGKLGVIVLFAWILNVFLGKALGFLLVKFRS